ncbi:serine hydrolase domain-containing protein [Viridibacillus sp. NPDC096237]|uniref:serine hydrolase domain-containing protein n=1 Tax=Viridibacillus sp. NPDC096237 TaxID=3390721 RepID=UPI003D0915CA
MAQTSEVSQQQIERVADYVQERMNQAKIPGAAVVIVQGDKLLYNGTFGLSDMESGQAVKSNTLFELASTTKAFTALAILKLEQEGRIKTDDVVTKYIPEFHMYYQGKKTEITVEQLLNQTSGIAFKSIDKIPEGAADNALEKTVQTLIGEELLSAPGAKFSYATINYDVLGLIIQRVTGQSYEAYMTEHILKPIGMNNTYLLGKETLPKELATGYKVNFLQARPYEAPVYRGNTPAGYIITNADDIEKWLKVQLGTASQSPIDNALIMKSHEFDKKLLSEGEGWIYKEGWYIEDNGKRVYHNGNNPNFSSTIFLEPDNQLGVALLANMNSDYTYSTVKGIMQILNGQDANQSASDMYSMIDQISVVLLSIMSVIIIVVFVFITRFFVQLSKSKRKFMAPNIIIILKISTYLVLIVAVEWFIYQIPQLFFNGVGWGFVSVWAPASTIVAAIGLGVGIGLLLLYLIAANLFRVKQITSSSISIEEIERR